MPKKRDMPPFEEQDRPKKVKRIYAALKRKYGESMPAEVKARIASRKGSSSPEARKSGPPYSGPLRYKRKKGRYVKKSANNIALALAILGKEKNLQALREEGAVVANSNMSRLIQIAFGKIMDNIREKLGR